MIDELDAKIDRYLPDAGFLEISARLSATAPDPKFSDEKYAESAEFRNRSTPELHSQFSMAKGGTITVTIDVPSRVCNTGQTAENQSVIDYIRDRISRLQQIRAAALGVNGNSKSAPALEAAIVSYNSSLPGHQIEYWLCRPSGVTIQEGEVAFFTAYRNSVDAARAAHATLFDSAENQLGKLKSAIEKIDAARREFETQTRPNPGIRPIENAIQEANDELNTLLTFDFGVWRIPQHDLRAQAFWAKAKAVRDSLTAKSQISELDRLRNEYAENSLYTPVPGAFVQTVPGMNLFDAASMNTGDYSWFIVSSRMLSALNSIFSAFIQENEPWGFSIESGYRNPARNILVGGVANSRHVFGDAADLNAMDYNKNGQVDSQDLARLKGHVDAQGFDFIQPKTYTIHVQFNGGLGS